MCVRSFKQGHFDYTLCLLIVCVYVCLCLHILRCMYRYYVIQVHDVMTVLGLSGCKDVYVGDAMIRGVSGGQKRRVTVGEMMLLRKYRVATFHPLSFFNLYNSLFLCSSPCPCHYP